jgi:hypothetical protein
LDELKNLQAGKAHIKLSERSSGSRSAGWPSVLKRVSRFVHCPETVFIRAGRKNADEDTGMMEEGRKRRVGYAVSFMGEGNGDPPVPVIRNRNDSTIPRGDGMKAKTVRTVFVLVFGLTWLMQSMVLANTAGYTSGARNQVTVDQTERIRPAAS